ncbi:MAG TPA: hypothetical protein DCS43_13165 [Verrucomicrobia bacterium]|nr:hypothetical protein [Verrucomicrobiota bacterium]
MLTRIFKLLGCAAGTVAFYSLCRFLMVPTLYLTLVAGWGCFCFLFSFELGGGRLSVRHGIEEKSMMHRAWMIVGLLCLLLAAGVMFWWGEF